MPGYILGKKSNMSQAFTAQAERIPVTKILVQPNYLLEVKTGSFNSIKVGYGESKNIAKPQMGELKKAGVKSPLRFFHEFRIPMTVKIIDESGKKGIVLNDKQIMAGEEIPVDAIFKAGEKVSVSGVSKGKGFQGVVRRHHFKGGPQTHGQSDRLRAPGAIGSTTTPGRVYKGKRMAGRMGNDRVTVKNLEVISASKNELVVKGLVPGAKSGILEIRSV